MGVLLRRTEGHGQALVAHHHGLDLADPAVLDLQSHRVISRVAVFVDEAEPGRFARLGVGDFQALVGGPADGAPEALADRHGDVVLGEPDPLGQGRAGRILVDQGVHVAVQEADQAGVVAGDRGPGAGLAGHLRGRG